MSGTRGHLQRIFPLAVLVIGLGLSVVGAAYIDGQRESNSRTLFELDAASATAEIEREIERHVEVVEETVAFAQATWPGTLDEWREFTDGRVTGGTRLAFSSTAGVIERVPADQIDEFEARESASSDAPFNVLELAPLPPEADRLVLTRTGDDVTAGIPIRGLEVSSFSAILGVDLPSTSEGIAVDSIEAAPEPALEILSVDTAAFDDNDILSTNVLLSQAIGPVGQEPLGWVIVPAEVGYLLTRAIDALDRAQINMSIAIPGTELESNLGTYEGTPGLAFEDAAFTSESFVDFGGWTWQVTVWAAEDFGAETSQLRGQHVLFGGSFVAFAFALIFHAQRRYRGRLRVAEFEADIQRTLAETDPLTGLLNRKGLHAFGHSSSVHATAQGDGCTVFFLDLDGFKPINDELGHAVGDRILVAVSRAIFLAARDDDAVGRLGGDEFVVICPGLCDEANANELAKRFGDAIRSIDDPARVDVSVGIAVTPPGETFDFDEALSIADTAMYEVKREQCESRGTRTTR